TLAAQSRESRQEARQTRARSHEAWQRAAQAFAVPVEDRAGGWDAQRESAYPVLPPFEPAAGPASLPVPFPLGESLPEPGSWEWAQEGMRSAVVAALRHAFKGRLAAAYDELLAGLKGAEEQQQAGGPWGTELVRLWQGALDRYCQAFGVRLE
ncbi:MAG TPA: hypothetical protein VK689_13680, partial [Armatimonadota bacterium]|nr:hypothetical protein [Armatimonadota bacterium]